jgi:Zn-dependent protease with chaperone function
VEKTYSAVYYDASGKFFNATIILSSITLSIRYTNHQQEIKDVYWLAENIVSLDEETTSSVLRYRNRDGKMEQLVIRDPELLLALKKHYRQYRFAGGWINQIVGSTKSKILLLASIFILLFLGGYFWFVPWLGERLARNISREWEIDMGKAMHQSILDNMKVDSFKTKLANDFYKQLYFDIGYPVSITVIESKEVNAFAVPGGHIVVYSAILNRLRKPEELAALLSHEASHIELRHSLRNIFRSMARKIFLMLIIGNESGLATFMVDNADNLKGLEYSRSLETEADNYGIKLLRSSQIAPSGMLNLMEILKSESKGKEAAEFLNTHPVFKTRMENIKKQIQEDGIPTAPHKTLDSIFSKLNSSW